MQNRIIKFRGFDKLHNTWIYGDLIRIPTDGGDYNTPPSSELTTYVTNSHVLTHEWVEVDPNSVGQFSGLLDKNGKEIYEGDVIQHVNYCGQYNTLTQSRTERKYKSVVEWGNESWVHVMLQNTPTMSKGSGYGFYDGVYEIIGNIYENPELIK